MARLQLTIDDNVNDILELLKRRNDKGRFIELAIKAAFKNPDIRELFGWKISKLEETGQKLSQKTDMLQKPSNPEAKQKIIFDDEFN
jgi:hypothetical protein